MEIVKPGRDQDMRELMLCHMISLTAGIIFDLIIGDPHVLPHPVRLIGKLISFLEKKLFGNGVSKNGLRDAAVERRRGALLWFIVVITTVCTVTFIMAVSYRLNLYFGIVVESILNCYMLAAGSLFRESMAVFKKLDKGDMNAARNSLSMIVGRDTDVLDEEEISKAAVETVAENTTDGVISPLLYAAIGGPVLGFFLKAVNTMDSMLGYRNDRYEDFGFFAAKADDLFNLIPSRISALFMILGSFLLGLFSKAFNGKRAFLIWKRDRLNHRSPNSAQTESVCAGALGIRLGGAHLYGGVMVEKPCIGDETRKTEPCDIKRANVLMIVTEMIAAVLVLAALMLIAAQLK